MSKNWSQPIVFQRIEGAVLFVLMTALYFMLKGEAVRYILVFAAVDLSIAGYLLGPKIGSVVYNLGHNMAGPLLCITFGLLSYKTFGLAVVGLIWLAHIGFDRALGLGLKFPDGFGHTHLGPIGASAKTAKK